MTTSVKNFMPPNLVSNLQQALNKRKDAEEDQSNEPTSSSSKEDNVPEEDPSKPRILVTNADGIESPGLKFLVEALVREGLYNVYVCAPELDKCVSGHAVTFGETVAVSSVEMKGATAYEVSGTPVDCISLALSGALFSWSKPALVVSGINKGSSCGLHMLCSGAVAAAREALMNDIPSISLTLNWKKDESQENDFKSAVALSVPIINAAARDIEKGAFPKKCALSIQIPTSPSNNKGFKVTKPSLWRSTLCWQATSAKKHSGYMANQPGLGIQLAQLGQAASAAGAARRLGAQRQNEEIESVGAAKMKSARGVKKNFRLELIEKARDEMDEDSDITVLENGFVAITPISHSPYMEPDTQTAAADWIISNFNEAQ
uniref:5'-nucleotidase n=1 Tax=Opuntia streptacantha TaxID=393608 RepID=A0A7C8YYA9_OPUST